MKKIIATLALVCVVAGGVFGQMINLREYAGTFGFEEGVIKPTSKYIGSALQAERRTFSDLAGHELQIDTPLEFALLSYYSQPVISIRPKEADALLPANNPKLADQKLGAAVFQEIQVLRFLGDTAAVNRHEAVLQFITDRKNVTRAEIETYYRNNIRSLIAAVVDEEFKEITVPASTVTYVKDSLTNFYTTPNQTNFAQLKRIYNASQKDVAELLRIYNFSISQSEFGRREGWSDATIQRGLDLASKTKADVEPILRDLGTTFEAARGNSNAPIDWDDFRYAYRRILNGLNTELVKRM
jgi:hypothetical protein